MSLVWVLAVAAVLGMGSDDETVKKEIERLQGTWTAIKIDYDGKPLPADGARRFKFVFKGDTAVVEGNDEIKKEYARITFKLDPSTMPRCLDLTVGDGVQKGVTMEGIYELKEEEFTFCILLAGKERPDKLEALPGSNRVLVVLKKDK